MRQPVLPPKLGRNLTTPWPRGACQGMHQQPRQMSPQQQLQEAEERWIWFAWEEQAESDRLASWAADRSTDSWQWALVLRGCRSKLPSADLCQAREPACSVRKLGYYSEVISPDDCRDTPSHIRTLTRHPPPSIYKENGHDSQKSHGKLCHWGFLPILRLGAEGCIKCGFVCGI